MGHGRWWLRLGGVAALASEVRAGTLVAAAGRVATLANEMGWRDAGGGTQLGGGPGWSGSPAGACLGEPRQANG